MANQALAPVTTRRERWSWYLYDFGNSAYASAVYLAVYSVYFKDKVVGGAEGTRLWGVAETIAAIVVLLSGPFLGTLADFAGSKKRFLLILHRPVLPLYGQPVPHPAGDDHPGHRAFSSWPTSATAPRRSFTTDCCPRSRRRRRWAACRGWAGPLARSAGS